MDDVLISNRESWNGPQGDMPRKMSQCYSHATRM